MKLLSLQATETICNPPTEQIELGAVLHALSDPVRLKIVAELAGGGEREYACGSFDLPVTKSTCTHHFRVLREAGVITQRQQGTSRLNMLRREDLDARFPGLLDTVLTAAHGAGTLAAVDVAGKPAAAGDPPALQPA